MFLSNRLSKKTTTKKKRLEHLIWNKSWLLRQGSQLVSTVMSKWERESHEKSVPKGERLHVQSAKMIIFSIVSEWFSFYVLSWGSSPHRPTLGRWAYAWLNVIRYFIILGRQQCSPPDLLKISNESRYPTNLRYEVCYFYLCKILWTQIRQLRTDSHLQWLSSNICWFHA